MQIPFTKYHGTGNDFILIDKRQTNIDLSQEEIALMCHRRFGIGADGLIFIKPYASLDFEMVYFNSDGNEGSMCGNGGRCITAFAHQLGIIKNTATFLATDGIHHAEVLSKNGNEYNVKVQLTDVNSISIKNNAYIINTGSPHYIEFIKDIGSINVFEQGRKIRNDKHISQDGINVNFVEINTEQIIVRTYERGVEDITLSCGTGVTASAIALAEKQGLNLGPVNIFTLGGQLKVFFEKEENTYKKIMLEGEAKRVFSGFFEL